MTSSIVPSGGTTAPASTLLYGALRKSGGALSQMPLKSSYVFQANDLARISAWIQQGAPDN
jgi:hypothetical protein